MDFIAELLFSIIVEASIELPNSKTPLPFKILASIIVFAITFGMGGFLLYVGCTEVWSRSKISSVIVFVCSILFFWAGVHLFRRMFGKGKEK